MDSIEKGGRGCQARVSQAPGLTRQTGGGPALCGTISISRACSQRGRVSTGSSGFGPKRLVLREPLRKYISTKPQMQSTKAIRPNGSAAIQYSRIRSANWLETLGATK